MIAPHVEGGELLHEVQRGWQGAEVVFRQVQRLQVLQPPDVFRNFGDCISGQVQSLEVLEAIHTSWEGHQLVP